MAKYANWYKVNLALGMDNADLADGDVVIVTGICPFPGRIKQIWCGALVLPGVGTLALANGSVNLLTATNVDLAALTAGTAASQTLAAGAAAQRVAAGNMLAATYTMTDINSGDGFAAEVWIEPDEF